MKKTIYLAGLISTTHTESLAWRVRVRPQLERAGFTVLSPMRGKENLVLESKDGGLNDPNLTSRDIILRDYKDVVLADVIMCHLENFGSPRPLIGTMCELAWAWEMKKPLIGIATAENMLMRQHPFVKEAVSHYVESTEEAVEFASKQFSE